MVSREDIAEAIADGLASSPDIFGAVQTYAEPPKAFTVPCVILSPRSPYFERETYTQIRMNLTATVVLPLGSNLDRIDTLLQTIISSLPEGVSWLTADFSGVAADTGVDYLTATIDIVTA